MNRRIWGIALLAMLPVAGVLAFIVWWLSRRQEVEEPAPRAILIEQGAPRRRPGSKPAAPEVKEKPVSTEVAEAASKPTPARRRTTPTGDDLKVIEGIGPKIAALLQANGISTYAQLAKSSPGTLDAVLKSANLRFARPASWPEQARLAANGEWEALKQLQNELKGGIGS
ncbi:MAG TPA: DUF4332 domain-containing protein [Anaerolineales bacterium]|nr:DUF4332 domain-containing protein [Anaerolineales bacterium]